MQVPDRVPRWCRGVQTPRRRSDGNRAESGDLMATSAIKRQFCLWDSRFHNVFLLWCGKAYKWHIQYEDAYSSLVGQTGTKVRTQM